ncbi:integrase [Bradyrhizobium diazoefficiens]
MALPEHVHAITKPNGRRYLYFSKFRRTEREWPRVRILDEPLTEGFARRIAQLPRLEAVKTASGVWAWTFLDAIDRKRDLPLPDDVAPFWAAVDKAEETGKMLLAGDRKTWRALIARFKDSDGYAGLSKSMSDQYNRYIKVVEAAWGDDPVRQLRAPDIQQVLDTAYKGTPQAGRVFRATLSVLFEYGIPRDFCDSNPAEHTEKAKKGDPWIPWPPEAFALWFEHARVDMHLPVYSALFTGQRKETVLNMQRPKSDAKEIQVYAQKIKSWVPAQIHSEYRQLIDAVPVDADKPQLALHLMANGQPWTYEGWKTAWQREIEKVTGHDPETGKPIRPLAIFAENRWVFHGLRKNAVCMLLEVGCTTQMVSAIVGMSEQMVNHYAKEVSKFRLARGAIKLLEDGWSEQRVHVLGAKKDT